MKILVSIPCLYGPEHTQEAIESVVNKPDVDLLLIDNGAEESVKKVIIDSAKNNLNITQIISNHSNIYVNPAWQQAIDYFLNQPQYDYLILMNSDLIMHHDWDIILKSLWAENPDDIYIPEIINDKTFQNFNKRESSVRVYEGTPGVFITLNRKQAEIINPIPKEIKVWFGDNWIYDILRGLGYKTIIPNNLLSYHYWSQNVQKVEGISELIEEDKRQWQLIKHRVQERIEVWKRKN